MRSPRGRERWLPTIILLMSLYTLQVAPSVPPADAQTRRSEVTFAVKNVPAGDVLNIRDQPGGKQIVGQAPPDARGILALGPRAKSGGGTWAKIRFEDISGWINVRFLGPDTLQTASTATQSDPPEDLAAPGGKTPAKVFDGIWSHERWTLIVAPDQIELLVAGNVGPASRTLALGSRDCGVVYERNFASLAVDEIPSTFTDPRFQNWANAATRGRSVAVMIVTCGAIGHRYLFLLTDMRKLLVAEWKEQAWLMFEEFVSDAQRIGRQ